MIDISSNRKYIFLLTKKDIEVVEVGGYGLMTIFDLPTSKARYELKVVLIYLGALMTRRVPGFIWMHSAIFS